MSKTRLDFEVRYAVSDSERFEAQATKPRHKPHGEEKILRFTPTDWQAEYVEMTR